MPFVRAIALCASMNCAIYSVHRWMRRSRFGLSTRRGGTFSCAAVASREEEATSSPLIAACAPGDCHCIAIGSSHPRYRLARDVRRRLHIGWLRANSSAPSSLTMSAGPRPGLKPGELRAENQAGPARSSSGAADKADPRNSRSPLEARGGTTLVSFGAKSASSFVHCSCPRGYCSFVAIAQVCGSRSQRESSLPRVEAFKQPRVDRVRRPRHAMSIGKEHLD